MTTALFDADHRSTGYPPHRLPKILIADESPWRRLAVATLLSDGGYEIREVSTRNDVLQEVAEFAPDLALLDEALVLTEKPDLCQLIRNIDPDQELAIILLARHGLDEQTVTAGFSTGADDYVCAIERPNELRARMNAHLRSKRQRESVTRVRRERDLFRRAASLDALTGVPNRNAALQELARRAASGDVFAVFHLDVDGFKLINDRFGHKIADHLLRRIAGMIQRSIRPDDACGRLASDELMVLASATTSDAAFVIAERHRAAVEALTFPELGQGRLVLTVSIGVAVFEPGQEGTGELVARAESAMQEAKLLGRNQVVMSSTNLTRRRSSTMRVADSPQPEHEQVRSRPLFGR